MGHALSQSKWGLHGWNKVKVAGVWYNIDTTWAHPQEEFGKHNEYSLSVQNISTYSLNETSLEIEENKISIVE